MFVITLGSHLFDFQVKKTYLKCDKFLLAKKEHAESLLPILCFIILRKRPQEKGLILNFMNRNLFRCVLFLARSVLLVCTDAMKKEIFFWPLIANMLFFFDVKRMEKVFRRFCRFIIMFESYVILALKKFAYVG